MSALSGRPATGGDGPRVTVIITSYNREDFLGPAIESVLAQSFEDFELLVVDDASADRSEEVARSYAERDPRVRVVANTKNLGDYGNRNHAASLVRTPLFKYHDSDDLMYPHCLQVMTEALLAEPRAGFALSASRAWNGGPCPMLLSPRRCYQREFLGTGMFSAGPALALFRTDVFHRLGGFPLGGAASDYLFWLQACRRTSALLVPADLFWYRVHPGQELTSAPAARAYASTFGATWEALAHPECPLEGDELRQARRNVTAILARLTLRDLRGGRPSLALHRLRAAGLRPGDWLRYLRRPRRDPWAGSPTASGSAGAVPPRPRTGGDEEQEMDDDAIG